MPKEIEFEMYEFEITVGEHKATVTAPLSVTATVHSDEYLEIDRVHMDCGKLVGTGEYRTVQVSEASFMQYEQKKWVEDWQRIDDRPEMAVFVDAVESYAAANFDKLMADAAPDDPDADYGDYLYHLRKEEAVL